VHWVLADNRVKVKLPLGVVSLCVEMLAPMFKRVSSSLCHNVGEGFEFVLDGSIQILHEV
jgi:hypothetical protein